jgi:hypothetical protein
MNAKVEVMMDKLPELQNKANETANPDEKIKYLKQMLDMLYEYKILYYDNGVEIFTQDVEDLINEVIDCISEARV